MARKNRKPETLCTCCGVRESMCYTARAAALDAQYAKYVQSHDHVDYVRYCAMLNGDD